MRTLVVLLVCLFSFSVYADDGDYSEKDLRVLDPATLATPVGIMSAAIYAVIDNPALTSDELIAVTSPWAEEAGFNATQIDGGQTKNFPIGSVLVTPGSTTVLGPGVNHIKLTKLRRTLQLGDEVPLILTFAKAGERKITAKVLSGGDLIKLYPVETTILTIKKLQSEQGGKYLPQGLAQ